MNRKACILVITYFIFAHAVIAQTIGLFLNDSTSYNGYTLFSPTGYKTTYLIDNCGELINSWDSEYNAGQMGYLLEDGSLLRAGRINSEFNGGGSGGILERFNWEGERTWQYRYSNSEHHHHHDIEVLPNGNILILAWESHTQEEAILSGRDPAVLLDSGLWSEHVIEIRPIGTFEAEIVWEWHSWDHLVQDYDSTAANFGLVKDHPELINFNFVRSSGEQDWIHANSVDYNPVLDQVMINCRNFEEFWIIDHSTTIDESAGHSGGGQGKGGDLLYRWGNPSTYDRGLESEAIFYLQHDAHWITEGLPDEGKILVFNNGGGRPGGSHSSIDMIDPPIDSTGAYSRDNDEAFGPDKLFWTYDGGINNSFYSPRVSGAERMPNGNTLICIGITGEFFEINQQEQIVWQYLSPISRTGPVDQGTIPNGRDVFRAFRYDTDYPGLAGRDLSPMGPLELDPLPSTCLIYGDSVPTAVFQVHSVSGLKIYPNPVADHFTIESDEYADLFFDVVSSSGTQILRNKRVNPGFLISAESWPSGMYLIHVYSNDYTQNSTYKVVKI